MGDHHHLTRRGLLGAAAATGVGAGAGGQVLMRASDALAQGVQPRRGGVLQTMLTPEPPVLALGVNSQGPTVLAGGKLYQGLVKFSPRLEPLPELAESWQVSDDGREYVFKVRQNATFHDGRPCTAEDVVFSLTKFHTELSPRARAILRLIRESSTPDAHTARFVLERPFEPFLLALDGSSCSIHPKHIYDGTDYRTNPANARAIGTGPFRLAEWQRGNFIRLERHEGYWKPGQPYLDGITYRIVPDSQSRALALQTGQALMSAAGDIEPFDVPRFRAQPNLEVRTDGWELFSPLMWIETNHRVAPLGDPRVRRAISHALDRNFIAQRLWFGVGKPATSPIASTTRFHDPAVSLPAYDPRAARELLDAAGLRAGSGGTRATFRHLVLPYGEVWTRLAEYIRQSLRQVGLEVTLESTDAGSWARRIADWEYDTSINFLYQFGDPTLGVERTYVSSNIQKITFSNTGGYANPRVDALFARARESGVAEERRAAFSEVQKLLAEEVPQIWLLEMAFPTIHDRRLRNVITTATGPNGSFDDVFLAAA